MKGVTLPCVARIDLRMSANWTFDLNAPKHDNEDEPDHMEQDAPHIDTHTHTTHIFPDSFTGTSSGYQSREEYNYTDMRTTLDDIFNEIKDQNDAEVERDVLLRNIHRQQEEMRITIDQLRDSHVDYVERTEHNMVELNEQMTYMCVEVSGMR